MGKALINTSIIFLFWYSNAIGQPKPVITLVDSTICLPLWMGRKVDMDLRLKDKQNILIKDQDQKIGTLTRQIASRDSTIDLTKIRTRALVGLCENRADSVKSLYVGEKKRRKGNGMQRNIAIVGLLFSLWLATKP